ncbi:hypothetical protein TM48_05356 [Mycobacterium shottsii]|nr:hypothetical protein TM48_05356 [Mycobacterium shottsii]
MPVVRAVVGACCSVMVVALVVLAGFRRPAALTTVVPVVPVVTRVACSAAVVPAVLVVPSVPGARSRVPAAAAAGPDGWATPATVVPAGTVGSSVTAATAATAATWGCSALAATAEPAWRPAPVVPAAAEGYSAWTGLTGRSPLASGCGPPDRWPAAVSYRAGCVRRDGRLSCRSRLPRTVWSGAADTSKCNPRRVRPDQARSCGPSPRCLR